MLLIITEGHLSTILIIVSFRTIIVNVLKPETDLMDTLVSDWTTMQDTDQTSFKSVPKNSTIQR